MKRDSTEPDLEQLAGSIKPDLNQLFDEHHDAIKQYLSHRLRASTVRDYSWNEEDLLQQVFERATVSINKGKGPNVSPRAWFITIARNLCHDMYNKARSLPTTIPLEAPISYDYYDMTQADTLQCGQQYEPEYQAEQREEQVKRQKLLDEMLRELPQDRASAIRLHDLKGLSYEQISQLYPHLAPDAIQDNKQKGMKQLQRRVRLLKEQE